jgi:hypothetical protein
LSLKSLVTWAPSISALAEAIGVPLLLWYTFETRELRKIAQCQLKAATSPNVFFDDAGREENEQWEEVYVINGSSAPAFKVSFRVGQSGHWRRLPNLLAGERRKLPVGVADLINGGLKEKADEGTIQLEYHSASGERFESRAALRTDDTNFFLEAALGTKL